MSRRKPRRCTTFAHCLGPDLATGSKCPCATSDGKSCGRPGFRCLNCVELRSAEAAKRVGVWAPAVALIATLLLAACEPCRTDPPLVAAKRYVAELGLKVSGISCAESDTDGDGYVSCTLNDDGRLTNIQCAVAVISWSRAPSDPGQCPVGCKLPKPSVGVVQQ